MQIFDNPIRYGLVSRALHWLMFLAYLAMFAIVILKNQNPEYKYLMAYHVQVGLILLGVTGLRFLWALVNFTRRPASGLLAKLGHLAIYGLMFAVPAIGLARKFGKENGNEALIQLGNQWHGLLGWVLAALVVGHVLMAIYHQLRGEKMLQRMA